MFSLWWFCLGGYVWSVKETYKLLIVAIELVLLFLMEYNWLMLLSLDLY